MVKDLRTSVETSDTQGVLNGDLDEFMAAALAQRVGFMKKVGMVTAPVIREHVAAVSCGISKGAAVLDLDYDEDSSAEADSNFVLTGGGDIVEIQATGEKRGFTQGEFEALFSLARKGMGELFVMQRAAVGL